MTNETIRAGVHYWISAVLRLGQHDDLPAPAWFDSRKGLMLMSCAADPKLADVTVGRLNKIFNEEFESLILEWREAQKEETDEANQREDT